MSRCRLIGHLRARLTQACVATLEPLPQSIEEEFEVEFWPAGSLPETVDTEVEALSVPDVEPVEHGTVRVGRVVFETLAAALDPYPRKSGAESRMARSGDGEDTGTPGPFEALKKLKDQA